MSARHEHDRGLVAVARVRDVRERDSLFGLRRASEEHDARQVRADQLDETVRQHAASGAPAGQPLPEWAAQRRALVSLATAARSAHDDVAAAARLKATAHGHWQRDRARLRAVQQLLEHRAEARRAELARTEARELDDIGGQAWLRRREAKR